MCGNVDYGIDSSAAQSSANSFTDKTEENFSATTTEPRGSLATPNVKNNLVYSNSPKLETLPVKKIYG